MKRNGSTRSTSIWGLLWRNPKDCLILISFMGCTSHFCFDIFYIVDFHSALNSQVSVPFKVIPIENLSLPDQRVPDNRTFMFTTLPDPKLKNHYRQGLLLASWEVLASNSIVFLYTCTGEGDAWLVSWHLRLTSLATFSIVFVKAKQEISSVLFSGRTLPMVSFSVGLDKTSKKLFGADPCLTCLTNYQRIWPRSNSRKGKPLKFQLYVTCSALHMVLKCIALCNLTWPKYNNCTWKRLPGAWCLDAVTLCVCSFC